jgi:hypothetical protein
MAFLYDIMHGDEFSKAIALHRLTRIPHHIESVRNILTCIRNFPIRALLENNLLSEPQSNDPRLPWEKQYELDNKSYINSTFLYYG